MQNYLNDQSTVFAFNIWDINSARAVMDAAVKRRHNVILQTSASAFGWLPKKQLREFVTSYSKEFGISAWLHLDHCRDMKMISQAIASGWDSVMIDVSDRPIEENIKITNTVVEMAHSQNVLVEAEIGMVQGVEDHIAVREAAIASQEDIEHFLQAAEIDMIAVAFGNAHGVYHGEPQLHYELVEYTGKISNIPFVVHGGSGLPDEDLKRLIAIPNVKKINISTDVKSAYRRGLLEAEKRNVLEQEGFQAINVERYIHRSISELTERKLELLDL